jgi:hypothetical protein
MLMAVHVDRYNCAFIDFVHTGLLVEQPWTHEIRSLKQKFNGSLVGSEARIHIGVRLECAQIGYAILIDEDEM